ncbi:hypothetical protein PYW08_006977 [Mythimna loreyi]|uniref:Uncharacterized protein n=1 Tax=Mythimna loreyi TaxID=667449 RepID=A0ACC2RAY4_9NEOP|nr:hypothetical protein PYW08_006977 [Mythimna loreyi]
MYHTPPRTMVKTRSVKRKEEKQNDAQAQQEDAQQLHDEHYKVECTDTYQEAVPVDCKKQTDDVHPEPSAASVCHSTRKKSSTSSITARKKQLELKAAQAKAEIRMELIDLQLGAELAELEDESCNRSLPSEKYCSEKNDRIVEKWLESSQQELKTQGVTDNVVRKEPLRPAQQDWNLYNVNPAGPQRPATEPALEPRPPPPAAAGGTDETVRALAMALKDLATASATGASVPITDN